MLAPFWVKDGQQEESVSYVDIDREEGCACPAIS